MIVGIDLGTTNSLVAYWTPAGPQLIPNALGSVLTPSVVGIDNDDHWVVGQTARELQTTHPERCAAAFKRQMGSDWSVMLGRQRLSAIELSSMVLRSLKADAEAHLGQTVDEAVITVPAYFHEPQRQATLQAGRIAGFHVRRILNEPTAAAIAYGIHEGQTNHLLLIYDLGGGTFDVSIVDCQDGVLEIRASAGEIFLGGEDFTTVLAARALEAIGSVFERAELESPLLVARLRRECETAKRKLSQGDVATVRIPNGDGSFDDKSRTITISPAQFAAWSSHILARTDSPLRRALGDARLTREEIDEVILVGGATRMPTVRQRVSTHFGKEPQCRLNPDEVVALGAAVQSGLIMNDQLLSEVVVTDVAPFTLGIAVSKDFGGKLRDGYFDPIINRNTTIPVSRVQRYNTTYPNLTSVVIRLFQGEARRVEDNILLGEFRVEGIPRGPAGQEFDVRFTYDLNGILEVDVTIVATGKRCSHVVTRHASHLSDADLLEALAKMQTLKTHPRDEADNRHLLSWGERVFRELPQAERRVLEDLLGGFERALEDQDRAQVEMYRDALKEFLNRQSFDEGRADDEQPW